MMSAPFRGSLGANREMNCSGEGMGVVFLVRLETEAEILRERWLSLKGVFG